MIVSQYVIAFFLFSFIGWIYECIYCMIIDKHWDNRGFLFGPICPIYGSSVVLAMIVFGKSNILKSGYETPVWLVFIICALMSAVIEYSTSYVLERMFHAIWWDYSMVPLNLNGRICLPATLGFGIVGVLVVRYLLPFVASIPMDDHPLANEVLALVFMLILGIDLAATVASLTDMLDRIAAMQANFDRKLQNGYKIASSAPAALATAANNAVNAGKEITGTISGYVSNISHRDRHHLRSIRVFKSERNKSMAERIKKALSDLRNGKQEINEKAS